MPMTEAIRPYFAIWTDPRATIRRIVEVDPARNVLTLAALSGALGRLESAWFVALGGSGHITGLWPIGVAIRVALGAVFGIIGLYIGAWLIGFFCRIVGGVASSLQMRTALAWATIPSITASILSIALVLFGIISPPEFRSGRPVMSPATVELGLLNAGLLIWGFVVHLKCIAEVNRFSAWRALTAIVLLALALAATVFLVVRLADGVPRSAFAGA